MHAFAVLLGGDWLLCLQETCGSDAGGRKKEEGRRTKEEGARTKVEVGRWKAKANYTLRLPLQGGGGLGRGPPPNLLQGGRAARSCVDVRRLPCQGSLSPSFFSDQCEGGDRPLTERDNKNFGGIVWRLVGGLFEGSCEGC